MTLLSVIIPTCHRNDHLARCLGRLAPGRQTLAAEGYEVIVTDDGTASTAEAVVREGFPWARWVAGPHRGPAANRNHGAKTAAGTWLVFTDDDCLPDPTWLEAYAAAIADAGGIRVFEGRTYAEGPQRSLGDMSPVNETGNRLYSCNLGLRTDLFAALHGFDERFRYAAMEDVDLAYRLREAGEKTRFIAAASVCHPWRRTSGWQQLKIMNDGLLTYLALHPDEAIHMNTRFYLKESVAIFLRKVLGSAVRGDARGVIWSVKKMASMLILAARTFRLSP